MAVNDKKFMEWLVQRRSENQTCCLELHKLLVRHAGLWKKGEYFFASTHLVGAVFLAGKKDATREAVFDHSVAFLETVIRRICSGSKLAY